MKKGFIAIAVLISLNATAQDTTKVIGLQLNARTIETLVPVVLVPTDDEKFEVFLKWRAAFKKDNHRGANMVRTDTIPVTVIVNLYDALLSNPEGYGGVAHFKTQITPFRVQNSYLDRLLTEVENIYTERHLALRRMGRRSLTKQD